MKPTQASRSSRYDLEFSRIESQVDAICQKADERLLELLSDDRLQIYVHTPVASDSSANHFTTKSSVQKTASSQRSPEKKRLINFELRLGSIRIPLNQLSSLKIDEILPLANSQKGVVQIWSREKLCGAGALLVVDGKLAVKIDWIDANAVV